MKRSLPAPGRAAKLHDRLDVEDIELPSKPRHAVPRLADDDLTELRDRDLMELFSEFVQWTDYLAVRLAVAEVHESEAAALLTLEEARYLSDRYSKGATRLLEANRRQDPKIMALRSAYEHAHDYRKVLGVLVGNVERDAGIVSRELTRRTAFEPAQRRHDRHRP